MKARKTDEDILREIEELRNTATLKIIRVGTNETNFKILKMLPSNVENIMKELCLTKVPVTVRLNLLDKMGLVNWRKGTGNVVTTDFGKFFFGKIETFEDVVREHVVSISRKHLE